MRGSINISLNIKENAINNAVLINCLNKEFVFETMLNSVRSKHNLY